MHKRLQNCLNYRRVWRNANCNSCCTPNRRRVKWWLRRPKACRWLRAKAVRWPTHALRSLVRRNDDWWAPRRSHSTTMRKRCATVIVRWKHVAVAKRTSVVVVCVRDDDTEWKILKLNFIYLFISLHWRCNERCQEQRARADDWCGCVAGRFGGRRTVLNDFAVDVGDRSFVYRCRRQRRALFCRANSDRHVFDLHVYRLCRLRHSQTSCQ